MTDHSWSFGLRAGEEWRPQHELNRHAQRHALAVIIGPPPSVGGPVNTASACILDVDGRPLLVTANHVLEFFERRVAEDPAVHWQISAPSTSGSPLVFDPRERVIARNQTSDIAAIELAAAEVTEMSAPVCSAPLGFPPPAPKAGDYIALSGYPLMYRERDGNQFSFPALSAVFEVTASGPDYLVVQWERERIVAITGPEAPPPGSDLGGMSGGPVFMLCDLVYPLIGVISDFQPGFELLRVAHLSALPLPRTG